MQVDPDKISLVVEDSEEGWGAPDVVIRRAGEELIQIDRPFAKADKVDLPAVLAKVGSMDAPGGLVVVGEDIMLRNALLLSVALAPDDRFDDALNYEDTLERIVDAARHLGRQLAGYDDGF